MTNQKPSAQVAQDSQDVKAPDPRRHYDTPEQLASDEHVEADEKRALLIEWKQDLEQRIEAEAEGMSASDPISSERESKLAAELKSVTKALDQL